MAVRVLEVEGLVIHYLWMLEDLKEVRDVVGCMGFDVEEEKKLAKEVREALRRIYVGGRVVI